MTDIQKIRIEEKRQEYLENKKQFLSYGSDKYSTFGIYIPTNNSDTSITIISVLIDDITEENIPFTKTIYYNVLYDGSVIMMDLIMTKSQIAKYVSTLTKMK